MENRYSFPELRERMVARQIEARGIHDPRLLQALRQVPRHLFVPPQFRDRAYDDTPLPIGFEQTISQPFMVALMTALLELTGSEKVLEIGTGSGYQAAVLGLLAAEVHTVEYLPALAEQAAALLSEHQYTRVTVHTRDGSLGLPEQAPFDRILVTAGAPLVPPPLLDQLAAGGLLVIPVGAQLNQVLQVWQKDAVGCRCREAGFVSFVPLRGDLGWGNDEWIHLE